jgi:hypothetical protein
MNEHELAAIVKVARESKVVMGYTTQRHLLVDLDNVNLDEAIFIAKEIRRTWPMVGGALVVESSPHHYHLVFDNYVDWAVIEDIIEALADIGVVEKNYAWIRTFRRDLTLRVSDKKGADYYRPAPTPVAEVETEGFRAGVPDYLNLVIAYRALQEAYKRYWGEYVYDPSTE